MAEPTKPEDTKPSETPPNPEQKPPEPNAKPAGPKRNKDGLIPGQRVSPKELAAVRLKQRKAAKK